MSKTVNSKILIRRDTTANWSTNNPTLAAGEIGFDTTVGKHKIGDGSTAWNSLEYFALMSDLQDIAESTKLVSYSTIVGDGSSTSFTILHGLNSNNLLIQCYHIDSTNNTLENIIGYYYILNKNSIRIDLTYAPATNGLKVAIMSTDVLANTERDSGTSVFYTLSKSGSTITLTGSDGSTSSVSDSDTTYTNVSSFTNDAGYQNATQVNALIAAALAEYGDGDTDSFGGS